MLVTYSSHCNKRYVGDIFKPLCNKRYVGDIFKPRYVGNKRYVW